jgi:hypothetical protein
MSDAGTPLERWLPETADLLNEGRGVLHHTLGGWSPAPNSRAQWELDEAERAGLGDVAALVHIVLMDWTEAADGHMAALAAVLRAGEVTHSVPYIVRAVMEHCHKIAWLLEDKHELPNGPSVTYVQRGARAHLEELYSLKYRRDTVKKMWGEHSPAFEECERQFVEFRDVTIPLLFSNGASTALGRHHRDWRIAGERWRGPTALSERYEKRRHDDSTSGTYDALSAYSHPTLYANREFVEHIPHLDGIIRRRTISKDFLERVTGGGAAVFWRAGLDLTSYFGWSKAPLRGWANRLNAWRPGLIGP